MANTFTVLSGPTPQRAYHFDAGLDLFLAEDVTLEPHSQARVPAGVSFSLDENYFVTVMNRSSTPGKGVIVPSTIVDAGYTGQVHIFLVNYTGETLSFSQGEKLAQAVLHTFETFDGELQPLKEGARGDNKTGSSDLA